MADWVNLVHNRIFSFQFFLRLFHNRFPFKGNARPSQKPQV